MRTEANQKWNTESVPALSVVMLGFRRADLLERAIASWCAHNSVKSWELILVLNGAAPPVQALADALLVEARFPLLVIRAEGMRPGAARNLGVGRARGEILFFLDDDTECFQDLGRAALDIFRSPEIIAAGGANLTPPASGKLERAAGLVFGSWFGAAGMRARYTRLPDGPADEHSLILCNLAVRRQAFFAQRGFAANLVSNEENVLLQQLEASGAKLWRSARLAVFHRRRADWAGAWEQAAKYGSGRAQNLLLLPQTIRPVYFIPPLFALYLLSLSFTAGALGPAALYPLALYLFLLFAHALYFLRRDRAAWLTLALFPCVHLAYGFGFWRALARWGWRRRRLLEHAF